MVLDRFHLAFSIILLGLLSSNYAANISADLSSFVEFFKKKENLFDIVYVISQLSNADQKIICSKFASKGDKIKQIDGITFVDLDPKEYTDLPTNFSSIPVFTCQFKHGENFFITYSENDMFHKLIQSPHDVDQHACRLTRIFSHYSTRNKVLVVLDNTQTVNGCTKNLNETRAGLYDYFQSKKYISETKKIFKKSAKQRRHICKLFPSKKESWRYKTEIQPETMMVHKHKINNVPCLFCHPWGYRDFQHASFKVFFYYNNIFFHSHFGTKQIWYRLIKYS